MVYSLADSAVLDLKGGPENNGWFDKSVRNGQFSFRADATIHRRLLSQDPYVKLTLHDGQFDEGGVFSNPHRGESVQTKAKDNAGANATFNETFRLNKPGKSVFT